MSGMQYIDGRFVFEDMRDLARESPGECVTVSRIPKRREELTRLTPRARKCIRNMQRELGDYLDRCGLSAAALDELRTEIYVGNNARLYVKAFARDDRGKEYESFIWR
jgi:hypothetical protein